MSKAKNPKRKSTREVSATYAVSPRGHEAEFLIGQGKFIQGDCLDVLNDLPADEFVLAFTSPPYLNAINYSQHIDKIKGRVERWKRENVSYDEYRQFLTDRFAALLRVIKPGGYNFRWNLPNAWFRCTRSKATRSLIFWQGVGRPRWRGRNLDGGT